MLIIIVGIVLQFVQMILSHMLIKLITSALMNVDLDNSVITLLIYVLFSVHHLLTIMEILILEDVPYSVLKAATLKMIQDNVNNNALLDNMLII